MLGRGVQQNPDLSTGLGSLRYGTPLIVDDPSSGGVNPHRMRMVVDFPAPFGPRKPVTVPGSHWKLTFCTASWRP